MRQGHKARLHHIGNGRYSVLFEGKLLVERSRDPECDAARVLLARGYTGTLHMLDGKTGEPRTIIDIEKAAKLRTVETGNAPRFPKKNGEDLLTSIHAPRGGYGKGGYTPKRIMGSRAVSVVEIGGWESVVSWEPPSLAACLCWQISRSMRKMLQHDGVGITVFCDNLTGEGY